MKKKTSNIVTQNSSHGGFLDEIVQVVVDARNTATCSVNLSMVYAYFEVGRLIVEEEQSGSERAGYGKQILTTVAKRLTQEFGRGFSTTNVEQMRKFYRVYASDKIPQKVSEELGSNLPVTITGRRFFLSY